MTNTKHDTDRRGFLKGSALTCAAFSLPFGARSAEAAIGGDKCVVAIFLRGAADGLNLVVPVGQRARYDALRPTIGIPDASLIGLNSQFSLHPSLGALKPLYNRGELAILHAVGSPHPTRSHFEAMDYMERANPGSKSGAGWLNATVTALGATKVTDAVGFAKSTPLSLSGGAQAVVASSLSRMRITGAEANKRRSAIEALFKGIGGHLGTKTRSAFSAADAFKSINRNTSVSYPNSPFSAALKDAAALIKSNLGVRVMSLDLGGWDHHSDEVNRMSGVAGLLAASLAAFWDDLGAAGRNKTVAMVMTEFGRTAKENGSKGTDHGHGSVMFTLGGSVAGGKVVTNWPGIGANQLYQGRDLKVTTDFRDVFSEVLDRHMGLNPTKQAPIFPGRTVRRGNYPGQF